MESSTTTALALTSPRTRLDVSTCRDCGEQIAWATSQRTGRRYPCQVGGVAPNLTCAPWEPHFKHCNH